jgi:hypothetical protein
MIACILKARLLKEQDRLRVHHERINPKDNMRYDRSLRGLEFLQQLLDSHAVSCEICDPLVEKL